MIPSTSRLVIRLNSEKEWTKEMVRKCREDGEWIAVELDIECAKCTTRPHIYPTVINVIGLWENTIETGCQKFSCHLNE
jgi:hypothetical protein